MPTVSHDSGVYGTAADSLTTNCRMVIGAVLTLPTTTQRTTHLRMPITHTARATASPLFRTHLVRLLPTLKTSLTFSGTAAR